MRKKKIKWKKLNRDIHLFVSLIVFFLLLFFAISGFIMNHGSWFGLNKIKTIEKQLELPAELINSSDLETVEFLRSNYNIRGSMVEFRNEDEEIMIFFERPGEKTDVSIVREDKSLMVSQSKGTLATILSDIHCNKGTEQKGGILISDFTAILLIICSITGIILWCSASRYKKSGTWVIISSLIFVIIMTFVFMG